jgi:hypothetical protein
MGGAFQIEDGELRRTAPIQTNLPIVDMVLISCGYALQLDGFGVPNAQEVTTHALLYCV